MWYFVLVEKKLLKAREVAAKLNVKNVTVRAWLKKGFFPNAELIETIAGKIWLIPESDVENFKPPAMGRPRQSKDVKKDSDKT